jgi:drug/metabolite transporter (DMT)-like permease
MNKQKMMIALCYLTLYIVWGSTYFFIKMSVETIPPFYVLGLRFAGGSVLLIGLALLARRLRTRPTLRQILASILLGSLLLLAGNGLITIAEQTVDSYIAALTIAATPMVVAAFDRLLLGKRISPIRLVGILVGMLGVALLLYNGSVPSGGLSPQILMVIGGVGCWGLATSLGHRLQTYPDPLVNSGIQMLFVGAVSLIAVSFLYPPLPQILPAVSLRSALAVLYLAVVGSLAFGAFTYLIAHEPAIRVSSYSLVNPVFATLLGLLVGDETPVPLLVIGLPLVLLGVALMLYGETGLTQLRARFTPGRPLIEHERGAEKA